MATSIPALITPAVLKWARKESGYDPEPAARRAGVPTDKLLAWEDGEAKLAKSKPRSRDGRIALFITQWTSDLTGKYRKYTWHVGYSGNIGESLETSDGKQRYRYMLSGDGLPGSRLSVRVREETSDRGYCLPLSSLCYFSTYKPLVREKIKWLDELIHEGRVELAGMETIDGREMPRLNVAWPDNHPKQIVLDPQHGFLPRRLRSGREPALSGTDITAYQRIDPPGIWFPVKGFFSSWRDGKLRDRQPWQVLSVQLNEELDETVFQPKLPEGARVADWHGNPLNPGEQPPAKTDDDSPDWIEWTLLLLVIIAGLLWGIQIWRRRIAGLDS